MRVSHRGKELAQISCESAVQEGFEEALGLAQGIVLHGTQALHSLHQGRKLLLKGERGRGQC